MSTPIARQQNPAAHKGGVGRKPTYTEGEILDMLVLLHEAPTLQSPETFTARTSARYRAQVISDRLAAYGMETTVNTYVDHETGGYRWTLTREDY